MKLARCSLSSLRGTFRWWLGLCFLIAGSLEMVGAPPEWWVSRGVVSGQSADDFATANVGQLKHFAAQAYEDLQARLPGGAGPGLSAMIAAWRLPAPPGARDDFAAVTLGQLKTVAQPFYDRLIASGLAHSYPWAGSPAPADDFALANVGQLKRAFEFDAGHAAPTGSEVDWDADGLPDAWERQWFHENGLDDLRISASGDADGDGISNLDEYLGNTNPTDYYNGLLPSLVIASGNEQAMAPTITAAESLSVLVKHPQTGLPLVNAPVSFSVTSGGGSVSPTSARTGSDGIVHTSFTAPAFDGTSTIAASASSDGQVSQAGFSAQAISPLAPTDLRTIPSSGPKRIKLKWDDHSSTETGFLIEKENPDGTWSVVGEVPPNNTEFEYTGGGHQNQS